MTVGLVIGAGGPVGVCWEVGVLASLSAQLGWDPRTAAVIVGTSAGAKVGASLGQGVSPAEMLDRIRGTVDEPPPKELAAAFADLSGVRRVDDYRRELGLTGSAAARAVARFADALPGLDEEVWVRLVERDMDSHAWPDVPLGVIAVSSSDGSRAVWTRESGVPLARAIASSMAVPGLNTPVTIGSGRFVDGAVWSGSNADVLTARPFTSQIDSVLFIGPCDAQDEASAAASLADLEQELGRCAGVGLKVSMLLPGEGFRRAGITLLDPSARARGVDFGLIDGRDAAHRIAAELGLGKAAGKQ
jgi:NTE family protein